MKLISNNHSNLICIEHSEMSEAYALANNLSIDSADRYLRKKKSMGTKGFGFMKEPEKGVKTLYSWNEMKDQYRAMVKNWLRKRTGCKHEDHEHCDCGNPATYLMKEPVRESIKIDDKAVKYFLAYRYDGPSGKDRLPYESVTKYAMAAGIFNEVARSNEDKKNLIKKRFNMDIAQYYINVLEICKELIAQGKLSGKFPTSYQRFITACNEYSKEGYNYLLPAALGNQAAAKVLDNDLSSDVLLSFIEHPNQYDDVMCAYLYNKWANENSYKIISPASVGIWRRKKESEIVISREGNEAFNERFIKQVKGIKPKQPLFLAECDDYNLNYYYTNPDLTTGESRDYQRYVSYIVADSAFGLVLGKCYRNAQSPTVDMVKLAWIDAMYYIRRLTATRNGESQWYLPFEVKADGWQKDVMHPYFKSIGKFVMAGHGNKHRGYIEQLFGSPHAKRAEKLAAHKEINYNGNNVTAAHWGVNVEALKLHTKDRPLIGDEAETQLERFFHYMQKMPGFTRNNMEEKSREAQWLEAWNQLSLEQKRPISDEQFLLTFGFCHQPKNGELNRITNRGIEPQINNIRYSYDLPDTNMLLKFNGAKVNVYYDPYDMSRVLVTNNEDIRFIAQSAVLHPRALQDATIGSRTALNMVLSEKKEQVKRVAAKADGRRERIGLELIDAEAVMLGGMMVKELKNKTEQVFLEQRHSYDALDQM